MVTGVTVVTVVTGVTGVTLVTGVTGTSSSVNLSDACRRAGGLQRNVCGACSGKTYTPAGGSAEASPG